MTHQENRELARIRCELRTCLLSQRYQGTTAILDRLKVVASTSKQLRGEYDRWRTRFELIGF